MDWQFTATEEERIAVHHLIVNQRETPGLSSYLSNLLTAIEILEGKVGILGEYLRDVKDGKLLV